MWLARARHVSPLHSIHQYPRHSAKRYGALGKEECHPRGTGTGQIRERAMTTTTTDPTTGLPIGEPANPAPAKRPERAALAGRHVQLAPLDAAKHTDDLFGSTCAPGTESLWVYLFDGPY